MSLSRIGFCILLIKYTSALKCWTCVGTDCESNLDDSKFAYTTQCEEGAGCQKTYFYYYNFVTNQSEKIGPVRSCSYPTGCAPIDEFATGVCDNWKYYQSLGCVKRYCCDTDLCNNSPRSRIPSIFQILILSLTVYGSVKIISMIK